MFHIFAKNFDKNNSFKMKKTFISILFFIFLNLSLFGQTKEEIITNMINDGVQRFIEIGPGNVLTNLVKRMSKEITSISISKVDDFEKLDNI